MAQPLTLASPPNLSKPEDGTPELWVLLVEQQGRPNHSLFRQLRDRIRVDLVHDRVTIYALAFEGVFDAIILHRPMEGADGSIALCRELRQSGASTPILLLPRRGSVDDIVDALDAGADDVMIEPVAVELLIARLRAFQYRAAFRTTLPRLRVGDLVLDLQRHVVRRGDREIGLSSHEYQLLEYLMRHRGEVLAPERIESDLRRRSDDLVRNADRIILDLQRKVDREARRPLIRIVDGTGYVFGEGGTKR